MLPPIEEETPVALWTPSVSPSADPVILASGSKENTNQGVGEISMITVGDFSVVTKTGMTAKEFHEVAESVEKSSELVGEIAAASQEQAQGTEQINKAVSQMDKVVQQNAANAEESASASEDMNAQADRMKEFVGELVTLTGSSVDNGSIVRRG
jgi:methyl-accepting chemotaxis protein